jgi:hypothetical protein
MGLERTCSFGVGLHATKVEGFAELLLEYVSIKLAGRAADRSPTSERLE